LEYFQKHNIKSIKLENDQLIIKYNNSQTETQEITSKEAKQIKSYCQSQGLTSLNLADLTEQIPNQQNKQPIN
jgi:hypothetical protein